MTMGSMAIVTWHIRVKEKWRERMLPPTVRKESACLFLGYQALWCHKQGHVGHHPSDENLHRHEMNNTYCWELQTASDMCARASLFWRSHLLLQTVPARFNHRVNLSWAPEFHVRKHCRLSCYLLNRRGHHDNEKINK